MTGVVLDDAGRALIFDRVTGEVSRHSVPTALENVALGQGRYVHGSSGEAMLALEEPAVAPEAVIALTEPDVLPLPQPEPEPAPSAARDAFDHDRDGRPGGSLPGPRPRRRPASKKK